jgi:cell division cycle 2-like protein
MAEMLTGENLFDDDDDDDQMNELNDTETDHIFQLWSIFQLLGMPDDQTWPEFKHMALTAKARQLLSEGQMHSRLREILPADKLSEQGFQVLQGLLTCNP